MLNERVKRSGFAAAGWAHGKHEAGRGAQRGFLQRNERAGLETNLFERNDSALAIEQAHHHRFTEHRDVCGYANVDFAATDLDVDLAVLVEAFLRHVDARENFDARDYPGREVDRKVGEVVQDAIDAHPSPDLAGCGFDVQIACSHFDRSRQQVVHQLHGLFTRFRRAIVGPVEFAVLDLVAVPVRRLAAQSLQRSQRLDNAKARRAEALDPHAEGALDLTDQCVVFRSGHGDM